MALVHRRDQHHPVAARAWHNIRESGRDIVTTNLVVAESHALIARRGGVDAGLRFWDAFGATGGQRIVWADEELTRVAVAHWVRRYRAMVLSLTDAVSFEVMEREGLREVFAFDEDFERVGFRIL